MSHTLRSLPNVFRHQHVRKALVMFLPDHKSTRLGQVISAASGCRCLLDSMTRWRNRLTSICDAARIDNVGAAALSFVYKRIFEHEYCGLEIRAARSGGE